MPGPRGALSGFFVTFLCDADQHAVDGPDNRRTALIGDLLHLAADRDVLMPTPPAHRRP